MTVPPGYNALREGAAWFELPGRGRIAATGDDRARLLHAMTTNHVQQLEPGQGCYAFFLNAQGRILSDVRLLVGEDAILLDTEPALRQRVFEHVDKYIIADDVALEDQSAGFTTVAVEGPGAAAVLEAAGWPTPNEPWWWASPRGDSATGDSDSMVARLSFTGGAGWWIMMPVTAREQAVGRLEQAGAAAADSAAAESVRIENGRPLYGVDFSEANIPQETQLADALHFNKGCYLGQEIVERVRSRGHVNRLLCALRIGGTAAPPAGAKVTAGDGKEAGAITSAAWSPALGKVAALALLRAEHVRPGAVLAVEGMPAELAAQR
jgi:tRNA-modifying protein YgfZ